MRTSLFTMICLLLTCTSGCVTITHRHTQSTKSITINNGILYVSYDVNDGSFSARRDKNVFIKEARFQEGTSDGTPNVRATRIQDALGSAQAIEVKFPSGYVYTLALYRNLPVVCIKSQMHNPTTERLIINKITPVSLQVDLGKAAEDLRILGCDGLTTAEKERTSYTFLAMAEPDSRSGVVTGWLTNDRASGVVLSKPAESSVRIEARSEYGNLLIEPGENAAGETFAIGYFNDALVGLEEYAGTIANIY
jgi:hypothetical protein